MRVLAISGSMRAMSTNTAALEALALVAVAGVEVVAYRGLAVLPAFNPDLDGDRLPAPVQALRTAIERADALVIFAPEYARGLAGSLKNPLDWLVSGHEFPGKRIALVSTSQRAEHAPAQLRLVLATMSGTVIEASCATLPLLGRTMSAAEIAVDPDMALSLAAVLANLKANGG